MCAKSEIEFTASSRICRPLREQSFWNTTQRVFQIQPGDTFREPRVCRGPGDLEQSHLQSLQMRQMKDRFRMSFDRIKRISQQDRTGRQGLKALFITQTG